MRTGSNVLPPKIQQHSSCKFGQLKVQLGNISVNSTDGMPFNAISFQPQFLGEDKLKTGSNVEGSFSAFKTTKIRDSVNYDILATLWHFYLYLNDMDFLKIRIFRQELSNYEYFCKLPIQLKHAPNQVLNSQFCNSDLLKSMELLEKSESNCIYKYLCDVWDEAGRIIGYLEVQISLSFDLQIHKQLIRNRVIDFSQMLVIDGISRIGSMGSSQNLISQRAFNPKNRESKQSQKQFDYVKNLSRQFSRLQQLKNETNHNEKMFKSVSEFQFSSLDHQSQKINARQNNPQNEQHFDEQKIMNDEIDRLVAEMQAKPYDSSRYQQNDKNDKNQSQNRQSKSPRQKSLSPNRISNHSQQIKTVRESKFPPLPSPLHKTHSAINISQMNSRSNYHQTEPSFYQNQRSQNYNSNDKSRKSQNSNNASQKPSNTKRVNFQDNTNTTPYKNLNQIPSQISVNSHYQNQQTNKNVVTSRVSNFTNNDIQSYKLHIHELLITGSNFNAQTSNQFVFQRDFKKYELSIFVVNQYNEQHLVSTLIGLPDQNQGQGCSQTVTFNHSSNISNSFKSSQAKIDKIRFQLRMNQPLNGFQTKISSRRDNDSSNSISFFKQLKKQSRAGMNQKQIVTQGYFDIGKLLNSNKIKGVFMIPIMHASQNDISMSKALMGELKLRKVQLPTYKTLRIQIEAIENLDKIVQFYINLSNINLLRGFDKVRYKVPYTKDTIQFASSQIQDFPYYHFNIFPHSKKFQTLLFQFWQKDSLAGICEMNLSKMFNIPYQTLVSGVQPIFLFDETRQIRGLVNKNAVVGQFDLIICFGTVKQVQIMLKKQTEMMNNRFRNRKGVYQDKKAEVGFDKKLGIFVKQKKTVSCVQIQVQDNQFQNQESPMQLKIKPSLKQQQLQTNIARKKQAVASRNSNENKQKFQQNESVKLFSTYSAFRSRKQQAVAKQAASNLQQPNKVNQNIQNQFDYHNLQISEKIDNKIGDKGVQKELSAEIRPIMIFLIDEISNFIAENLKCLSKESTFALLKQKIKPYTLYNFINADKIKQILQNLPIGEDSNYQQIFLKRSQVNRIVDQILIAKSFFKQSNELKQKPSETMINVKIFYDMILSLQLNNGKIKQNLIPDYMVGYHALQILYKQIRQEEDILFDEETQWSEAKAWMNQKGYKITMHDFNAIQQFLKSYISDYLKSNKVQKPKDNSKMQKIKNMILVELRDQIRKYLMQKQFEKQKGKMEEQEILKNLYNFDSSLNESVSRDHQQSPKFQKSIGSPFKSYSEFQQQILRQTRMNKRPHQESFQKATMKEEQEYSFNSQENQFLSKIEKNQDMTVSFRDTQFSQKQTMGNFQKIKYQESERDQKSIQQVQFFIQVSGIEACRDACQCLLDRSMKNTQIKIQAKISQKASFQICLKEDSKINITQLLKQPGLGVQKIEGKVALYDPVSKDQLSKANFCLINSVNSVYTMKNNDGQFCGLIHLQLKQTE